MELASPAPGSLGHACLILCWVMGCSLAVSVWCKRNHWLSILGFVSAHSTFCGAATSDVLLGMKYLLPISARCFIVYHYRLL